MMGHVSSQTNPTALADYRSLLTKLGYASLQLLAPAKGLACLLTVLPDKPR